MLDKIFFPNDKRGNHIKSLDGLRGIAVLIVIISHGSDLGFDMGISFQKFGKLGVDLFFILSAFLLDKQIIKAFQNKTSNFEFWSNYLVRRFLRIFPLFTFSLLIYYQIDERITPTLIYSKEILLEHLIFKKGDMFYWSIAPELEYYLLSPVLILILLNILKFNFIRVIIALVTIILLATLINHEVINIVPKYYFFKSLPFFLTGTILAFFWRNGNYNFRINNIITTLSILLIILTIPGISQDLFNLKLEVGTFKMNLPYVILLIIVFTSTVSSRSIMKKITELKLLRFLGKISFSLYLFHWAVGLIVKYLSYNNEFLETIIYLIISIGFSTITYMLIELPLSKIRLNTKIKYRKKIGEFYQKA